MIVRVRSFLFGIILMNNSLQLSSFEASVNDSYRILSKAYMKKKKSNKTNEINT